MGFLHTLLASTSSVSLFQSGNLEQLYPLETASQIRDRRLANWTILKTLCNDAKLTGIPVSLPNTRVEFFRTLNDKISLNSGHSLYLRGFGDTNMVFYPYIFRAEPVDHTPFQMDYGASIRVRDLTLKCAKKQGKFETYDAVLKKNANNRLIELTGTIRPEFWTDLQIGDTIYASYDSAILSDTRIVASFDSNAKTITTTADLSVGISADTTGKFCRIFTNEILPEEDYDTYGQFWYYNSGTKVGASGIRLVPAANSGAEASFDLTNVSIENFWEGLSISAGNFHVNSSNLNFDNCGVAFPAYARLQMNGQYISGDSMTFTNNGYNCIAQINSDSTLVFGSGAYLHPTIILTITDTLTLTNNPASAFRQFSSSIEEDMTGVSSYVNNIVASGNGEYDFYSSNCMPVTIDNFDGDQLWIGGSLTVNGGKVRELISASSNLEPPNGTPVDWEFNNMELTGRLITAFNALTEAVHDIVFNNCTFYVSDYTTLDVFIKAAFDTRSITLNDCEMRRAVGTTFPDYVPGSAIPAGEKSQYLFYGQGKTITINNLTTDYIKGGLFLQVSNLVRTPPYNGNKFYINNSEIGLSHITNNTPTIASFYLTDQFNGSGSKIVAFDYTGLGYNTPGSFSSKTASKSNVNIITGSTTYKNLGGVMAPYNSFNITGSLEIDLEHNEYFVNSGTINRITLPTWSGIDKIASESNYTGTITIHAVGGTITINGWHATTNEYGNISASTTIPVGTSKSFTCNNRAVISKAANSTVTPTIATGTGSIREYKGSLADYLVVPQNFSVTAGAVTGTANSNGAISGTGIDSSSFIDYGTGTYYIKFDSNVGNGVPVNLSYEKYNTWRVTGVFSEV